MDWLYQILSWFANFEILGGTSNILGFFWLLALMWISYNRFEPQFRTLYPEKYGKAIWYFALIVITFSAIFLMQMMLDDFIQTPICLVFGSWELRAAQLGGFSLYNLLLTKWDVYAMITIFSLGFYMIGVWRFFHFNKKSAIWLAVLILWVVMVAQTHYWTHLRFEGWMRIQVYWLTYPEFRVISAFFVGSIIRKPAQIQEDLFFKQQQHSNKLFQALLIIAFQLILLSPLFMPNPVFTLAEIVPFCILGEIALIITLILIKKKRKKEVRGIFR